MKVALLCLLACATGACDKKTERPAASPRSAPDDAAADDAADVTAEVIGLERVSLETVDPNTPRELYTRELGKRIGLQLTMSGAFASEAMPAPAGAVMRPAALRISISYDQTEAGTAGDPTTVASVIAALEWLDGRDDPAPQADVVTERPLAAGERATLDGVIAAQVARTVERAGDELIARAALRTAPDAEVVAALGDPDPQAVLWALELVTARRLAAAFDPLIELLDAGIAPVRDGAVAALVAIGDPRAVPALADRADFADHAFLVTIIDAAGALGGPDAEQFLEFLTSHHDPDIERRAKRALAQARDRP